MPFVTESLFICFYVPPVPCEYCKAEEWMNTSTIRCSERQMFWVAKTICKRCQETAHWQVDPDIPMEHQSVRSEGHDGSTRLIE